MVDVGAVGMDSVVEGGFGAVIVEMIIAVVVIAEMCVNRRCKRKAENVLVMVMALFLLRITAHHRAIIFSAASLVVHTRLWIAIQHW